MKRDPRELTFEGQAFEGAEPPDPLRQILSAALRVDEQVEHLRGMADTYKSEAFRLTSERHELEARILDAESRIVAVVQLIITGDLDDSDSPALQRIRSYADTLEGSYRARLESEDGAE